MNAVKFPDMISLNKTNIIKDKDATYQNIYLLLKSAKNTLLGDPYFGSNLKKLLFENNNAVLRDLVIDDIFTVITKFMPQVKILRKDITVTSTLNSVYVHLKAQNMLDYTIGEYEINLVEAGEINGI